MNKYEMLNISDKVEQLAIECENELKDIYKNVLDIAEYNSMKVLNAFWQANVSDGDFSGTSGYGYDDSGREAIERIYSTIFKTEDALVRNQFVSASHALTTALFALLRPNDLLLSITGLPYDTLHEVIGIKENKSSLSSFGILYDQIDLINDDFDYKKIEDYLKKNKVKVIEIQRSKGYSNRKSISIEKVEKVIKLIKEIDKNIIVMVDNCYCEFVAKTEPSEVGADIVVGSLIKNLGGGIAPNGAYIVGRKDLIELCGERLTLPGEGKEVGPTLGINKSIMQGLFFAPNVVASSIQTAIFTSLMLEKLGYMVEPKYNEERVCIVQNIIFHNPDDLIKYCQGIQAGSPIDSKFIPIPSDMPGYDDKIIMASGSFTQGSSIELSCDGPIREPYIAYQQGGLTYSYGKLGVLKAIDNLLKK
jgi:cystathionine beta-lyase family protein involved in aluminum resistance